MAKSFKQHLEEAKGHQKLSQQVAIDRESDADRAKFLDKVLKKHGDLKIVGDLNDPGDAIQLLGTNANDKDLKKAGFAITVSKGKPGYGDTFWWNDKKKLGYVEIGGGDFGCWVLKP